MVDVFFQLQLEEYHEGSKTQIHSAFTCSNGNKFLLPIRECFAERDSLNFPTAEMFQNLPWTKEEKCYTP